MSCKLKDENGYCENSIEKIKCDDVIICSEDSIYIDKSTDVDRLLKEKENIK